MGGPPELAELSVRVAFCSLTKARLKVSFNIICAFHRSDPLLKLDTFQRQSIWACEKASHR